MENVCLLSSDLSLDYTLSCGSDNYKGSVRVHLLQNGYDTTEEAIDDESKKLSVSQMQLTRLVS